MGFPSLPKSKSLGRKGAHSSFDLVPDRGSRPPISSSGSVPVLPSSRSELNQRLAPSPLNSDCRRAKDEELGSMKNQNIAGDPNEGKLAKCDLPREANGDISEESINQHRISLRSPGLHDGSKNLDEGMYSNCPSPSATDGGKTAIAAQLSQKGGSSPKSAQYSSAAADVIGLSCDAAAESNRSPRGDLDLQICDMGWTAEESLNDKSPPTSTSIPINGQIVTSAPIKSAGPKHPAEFASSLPDAAPPHRKDTIFIKSMRDAASAMHISVRNSNPLSAHHQPAHVSALAMSAHVDVPPLSASEVQKKVKTTDSILWINHPLLFYFFTCLIAFRRLEQKSRDSQSSSCTPQEKVERTRMHARISFCAEMLEGTLLNPFLHRWTRHSQLHHVSCVVTAWKHSGPESVEFDEASNALIDTISADEIGYIKPTFICRFRNFVGSKNRGVSMQILFAVLSVVIVVLAAILAALNEPWCFALFGVVVVAVVVHFVVSFLIAHHNRYADSSSIFFHEEAIWWSNERMEGDTDSDELSEIQSYNGDSVGLGELIPPREPRTVESTSPVPSNFPPNAEFSPENNDIDIPLDVPVIPMGCSYILGRRLGGGAYGSVFEVEIAGMEELCAVKRMHIKSTGDQCSVEECYSQMRDIAQEIRIMSVLSHSNIVQYLFYEPTEMCISIFMELCTGGSLLSMIKSGDFISEPARIKSVLRDIIEAVNYIHSKRIVHCDLKPENVLFRNGVAKLTDFGTATRVKEKTSAVKGTISYMAPEVLLRTSYSRPCDVWSIGCIAAEMLCVDLPQRTLSLPEMCEYYRASVSSHQQSLELVCDVEVVHEFLLSCLQFDPESRDSASELLQQEMLSPQSNDLQEWMSKVAEKRKNAHQSLSNYPFNTCNSLSDLNSDDQKSFYSL